MKKYFLIFITLFTLLNGLVWDKLIKGYREYYMEIIDSLEEDRVRLQLMIDEHEHGISLDGHDVVVTMYHPVRQQTDRTPNILADGTKITIHKASEYRYVAVSRNLLKRWGGWLEFGDFIVLTGTDGKDGGRHGRDKEVRATPRSSSHRRRDSQGRLQHDRRLGWRSVRDRDSDLTTSSARS